METTITHQQISLLNGNTHDVPTETQQKFLPVADLSVPGARETGQAFAINQSLSWISNETGQASVSKDSLRVLNEAVHNSSVNLGLSWPSTEMQSYISANENMHRIPTEAEHTFYGNDNRHWIPTEIEPIMYDSEKTHRILTKTQSTNPENHTQMWLYDQTGPTFAVDNNSFWIPNEAEPSAAADNNSFWIWNNIEPSAAADNNSFWIWNEIEPSAAADNNSFWIWNEIEPFTAADNNSFWISKKTEPSADNNSFWISKKTEPSADNNSFWISNETELSTAADNNSFWTPCESTVENSFRISNPYDTSTPFQNMSTKIHKHIMEDLQEFLKWQEAAMYYNQTTRNVAKLQASENYYSEKESSNQREQIYVNGNKQSATVHDPAAAFSLSYTPDYILITRTRHFYPSIGFVFLKNNEMYTSQSWCHMYTHEDHNVLACLNITHLNRKKLYFLTILDVRCNENDKRCKYEVTLTGSSKVLRFIGDCHTVNQSLTDIVALRNCLSFSMKKARRYETVQEGEDGRKMKGFYISIDLLSY